MRLQYLWLPLFLVIFFILPLKIEGQFLTIPSRNTINPRYTPMIPGCMYLTPYGKCIEMLDWRLNNFNRMCRRLSKTGCANWYTPEELENEIVCLTKGVCFNVVEVPQMQKDSDPKSNESQDDEFNDSDSDGGGEFNDNRNLSPLQRGKSKSDKRR